jgi:hypothetical protein
MKKSAVLKLAGAGEAVTGLVLLVYPPIVVRLLFGAEISGAGMVVSRMAGISLIALGLACLPRSERGWPGRDSGSSPGRALCGMLTYSSLATLYLAYLGVGGDWVGSLLWPAVAIHILLTFLLARAWLKDQRAKG